MADTPYPLPTSIRQTGWLVGNGSTTYGPFGDGWGIFDIDDVAVEVLPVAVAFTVAKTLISEKYATFSITFATALTGASTFRVTGRRSHRRELAVTRGGAIDGLSLELELSKQAVVLQEQRRDIDGNKAAADLLFVEVDGRLDGHDGDIADINTVINNIASGSWDARGPFASRSAHDTAAAGFTYLATDPLPMRVYVHGVGNGVWGPPVVAGFGTGIYGEQSIDATTGAFAYQHLVSDKLHINGPDSNVYLGSTVNPSRWKDIAAALIKGLFVVAVGTQIMLPINAKAHATTLYGAWVANSAGGGAGLYGVDAVGFRTIENMADGEYVQAFGIDAFKSATYGRNSSAFGAKTGLYKTDVQGAVFLGSSAAYAPGVVVNSTVTGAQAADGFASSSTVYSFSNATVYGAYCARGLKANINTLYGANASSLNDITGVANTIVGRSGAFSLSSGTGNFIGGDASGINLTVGNFNFLWGTGVAPTLVGGSNNFVMGYGIDVPLSTSSNYFSIDDMLTGDKATRAVTIPGTVTMGKRVVNKQENVASLPAGLNSNIVIPDCRVYRITSAVGAFSLGGFSGGVPGQWITIVNTSTFQMTLVNQDAASSPANRIDTLQGANVVLRAGNSSATFFYDSSALLWRLVCYN